MKHTSKSYRKVPYDLRIAKQIERRMIIDALQRMAQGGFKISDYKYTGMGSIYYVDFALFHRYVGLRSMLNVELSTEIRKRIKFNKPFRNIKLEFGQIGDFIPRLNVDTKHILWLDYDDVLDEEAVRDVVNATTQLSRGSLLLITVDVNPPVDGKPKHWRKYFFTYLKGYCNPAWSTKEFGQTNLFRINIKILEAAIKQGLVGRSVSFLPVFNFVYADGHEMLTIGGVIGTEEEKRTLDDCDFTEAFYLRRDLKLNPYRIRSLMLTRRERMYLDAHMPAKRRWVPTAFEIEKEDLRAYSQMYRFFPSYAELLL